MDGIVHADHHFTSLHSHTHNPHKGISHPLVMLFNRPPNVTTATINDHLSALSTPTIMASSDGSLSKV